jgi:hypothetical protein
VTLPFTGLTLQGLEVEPSVITDYRGFTALAYHAGTATGIQPSGLFWGGRAHRPGRLPGPDRPSSVDRVVLRVPRGLQLQGQGQH